MKVFLLTSKDIKDRLKDERTTAKQKIYPIVYPEIDKLVSQEFLRDKFLVSKCVFVIDLVEDIINDFKL